MGQRRGFYFSMDVLLFLFIISFGVVLVLAALPGKLPRTQPLVFADSVSSFLATTTTRDVFASADVGQCVRNGGLSFSSFDYTILEQVTLFVEGGTMEGKTYAKDYLGCIISGMGIVPKNYGVHIGIRGVFAYQPPGQTSQSDADVLVTSTRIVFFYDRQNHKTAGPYVAEVMIW